MLITWKIQDIFSFCEIQDNFHRKMSSTSISRLLHSWPGSKELYWRWEACRPAILCMRRQTQRVSFFPVIRTKKNCILSFWPNCTFTKSGCQIVGLSTPWPKDRPFLGIPDLSLTLFKKLGGKLFHHSVFSGPCLPICFLKYTCYRKVLLTSMPTYFS